MKDLKLCEGAQLQLCHKTNKNQLRALQAAEKLARAVGRGFIPGLKSIKSTWALAPAEILLPLGFRCTSLKGHDFNRAIDAAK